MAWPTPDYWDYPGQTVVDGGAEELATYLFDTSIFQPEMLRCVDV